MRTISRIIVHHSASPPDTTTLEDIDRWHRSRGFNGAGYHFVCEADGRIRKGRPIAQHGAHAKGANRDSVGICIVGDNTRENERWTEAQRFALVDLVDALRLVFGPLPVLRHRDVAATECPGLDDAEWTALVAGLGKNGGS